MLIQDFFCDWPDAFSIARQMGLDEDHPGSIVRISDRLSAGLALPLVDLFAGDDLTSRSGSTNDDSREAA